PVPRPLVWDVGMKEAKKIIGEGPNRRLGLMPGDQHDPEAAFVSHHPPVSFGSPESFRGQRNGFGHRTDLLQGQESVSSASIEEPVIVPASERIPNRSGTGATLIGYNRIPLGNALSLGRRCGTVPE